MLHCDSLVDSFLQYDPLLDSDEKVTCNWLGVLSGLCFVFKPFSLCV